MELKVLFNIKLQLNISSDVSYSEKKKKKRKKESVPPRIRNIEPMPNPVIKKESALSKFSTTVLINEQN